MTKYTAKTVMAGLKDFQRATVEHVISRFYGPNPTSRFLVADETGLGKSLVARGVIARALEHSGRGDSNDRFDVVYVCSNYDIAAQNLARLRVATGEAMTLASRLTLLAKHTPALLADSTDGGVKVNLLAFTPGTSFHQGMRIGKAEERAMLYVLLDGAGVWSKEERRAAVYALQGWVASPQVFRDVISNLRNDLDEAFDEEIATDFLRMAGEHGLIDEFGDLLGRIGSRRKLPRELRDDAYRVIGDLRTVLAKAGVSRLSPDLVILDEFQRFRHLLDPDEGGDAAELAHHLFDCADAKVLLLSATPYKPFTYAEETATGEDHCRDFMRTLAFLAPSPEWHDNVRDALGEYRSAVVEGQGGDAEAEQLRHLLLQAMSRTERPAAVQDKMMVDHVTPAGDLRPEGIRGFVTLRRLADAVDAQMSVEYWKSAPYFLNFVEGYQLGERLRAALRRGDRPDLFPLLASAHRLDADALRGFAPVELGNARLRQLAADTIDQGWWKVLWVPPSLPHYELEQPFSDVKGMTKRLLFSSWNATPTAVAGLLSYEAERRIAQGGQIAENTAAARRRLSTPLTYRLDGGRPSSMSTLALFWPNPALAALADPLDVARSAPDETLSLADVNARVHERVAASASQLRHMPADHGEASNTNAYFRWPGAVPGGVTRRVAFNAMSTSRSAEDDDADAHRNLGAHIDHALDVTELPGGREPYPSTAIDDLAALALHAPGNVAWRALGRLVGADAAVTDTGHWEAAARLADGIRSLFSRVEAILLLRQLMPETVYWRAILQYAAAGGLHAVLDEYLHHLRSVISDQTLTDTLLYEIAQSAADVLGMRPSRYGAFDPSQPDDPIPLLSRFALRYGDNRGDRDGARRPEVRNAFNSPFWPFVVATTSAGQEGIDFHWWCSAVVHWNTPANPVDFEQREGRVHRFGGHAVRRNVAARHRRAALCSNAADVWAVMYDAARAESSEHGDFSPYWVYPGDAKVERHVLPYQLSRDMRRLERLRQDLALYRLAFGQPRQEDMLELLRQRGITGDDHAIPTLDLRPPM